MKITASSDQFKEFRPNHTFHLSGTKRICNFFNTEDVLTKSDNSVSGLLAGYSGPVSTELLGAHNLPREIFWRRRLVQRSQFSAQLAEIHQ